ncbi:RPM1-interacting protein 4-like isoform X1 [Arachis stenosperma]|uniref:RPM1-interacting protein 4-like isoform X1 n=2 Tax=Arachis stenosperma TaxID=217475 RepID=UPI0025AD6388|nr:RPM1-interacting protein 4-like isoform X1 [Arachis stenosperma]
MNASQTLILRRQPPRVSSALHFLWILFQAWLEMAQRSHVPKFGNWESGENVPYTAYFDKARKDRTGTKMINPNDPEENSDLSFYNSSSDQLPPAIPGTDSEHPSGKGSKTSTHELQKSKEDSDAKPFVDSPARQASQGVGSADNRRRPSRQSTGSEYSIERSPLHRQARAPGKDSPSWEGKNSYDSSHGTPGRSRLRPANRGDETPDKGAAVPKFGEWDVSNPASADGYTHIFNQVREERQGGAGVTPGTPNQRPHFIKNQPSNDKAQCCCFWWSSK